MCLVSWLEEPQIEQFQNIFNSQKSNLFLILPGYQDCDLVGPGTGHRFQNVHCHQCHLLKEYTGTCCPRQEPNN